MREGGARLCQNQDLRDSSGARVLSESGFAGLWDFQDSSGARVCDGRALVCIPIGGISMTLAGRARFVRIRIFGIIGFSGFVRRARLRWAGACLYSDWRDFRLWRKGQAGRNEILKIL